MPPTKHNQPYPQLFVALLLPDTTGVPLDSVHDQRIYKHWLWRRFAPPQQTRGTIAA